MIDRIKRIFSGKTRKSSRWPVRSDVKCQVLLPVKGDPQAVYLDDVSLTGSSFYAKTASFEIDNTVQMQFMVNPKENIVSKGTIVSQNVRYPAGTQDLEDALYRFSVAFETPLSTQHLEKLRAIPRQKMN